MPLAANRPERSVIFYGVLSEPLEEILELFVNRLEAELVVCNWDHDEPDRAGELHVEPIELEFSLN